MSKLLGGRLENSNRSYLSSPPLAANFWINATAISLLIVLVYLLLRLGTAEANTKTITVSINGLIDTYITSSATVEELITELGLNNQQIISVTPSQEQPLTNHNMVTVMTKPTARNAMVATNMQAIIKEVAKAAQKKAEEAKRKAEAALSPKSPTYIGTATWYDFGKNLTAASTQFPKGTRLRVIAINSGKTVDVVINDYGPEDWTGVILDLNRPAFAKLAPLGAGKIPVKYYKI